MRKDFTPSEAVAIKRALEPLEKEAAKKRQRESGQDFGKGIGCADSAQPMEDRPDKAGAARQKVASAIGVGRTRLYQAEQVVKAAEEPSTRPQGAAASRLSRILQRHHPINVQCGNGHLKLARGQASHR